jgi:hypothetical protein
MLSPSLLSGFKYFRTKILYAFVVTNLAAFPAHHTLLTCSILLKAQDPTLNAVGILPPQKFAIRIQKAHPSDIGSPDCFFWGEGLLSAPRQNSGQHPQAE